jgi:hypothetical protein
MSASGNLCRATWSVSSSLAGPNTRIGNSEPRLAAIKAESAGDAAALWYWTELWTSLALG